ncbi:hypothetical protein U771_15965 [Pseudomonas gorinensis]|uniref:Uncharacterized protein n=1 Tax=Pseudomonas gorinensis TaxID=3240790 RepID=A0ACA7P704_9PSED|nr:hypothetical protein U771_15965 [Pseudomonas sp. TKP]
MGEVLHGIIKAQRVIAAGHQFFTAANIERLVHLGAKYSTKAAMIDDLRDGR